MTEPKPKKPSTILNLCIEIRRALDPDDYAQFLQVLKQTSEHPSPAPGLKKKEFVEKILTALEKHSDLQKKLLKFLPKQLQKPSNQTKVNNISFDPIDEISAVIKKEFGEGSPQIMQCRKIFIEWYKNREKQSKATQKMFLGKELFSLWKTKPELQKILMPLIKKLCHLIEPEKQPSPAPRTNPIQRKPNNKRKQDASFPQPPRKRKVDFTNAISKNDSLNRLKKERKIQLQDFFFRSSYFPKESEVLETLSKKYPLRANFSPLPRNDVQPPAIEHTPVWRNLLSRIKTVLEPAKYFLFLRQIVTYARGGIELQELLKGIHPILREKGVFFNEISILLGVNTRSRIDPSNDKCRLSFYEYVSQVNLDECEQIGESYRKLPTDCDKPGGSNRSVLGEEVLNNDFVCVSKGGEGSAKPPDWTRYIGPNKDAEKVNEFQQKTFLCNIWVQRIKRTLTKLREMQNYVMGLTASNVSIDVDESLDSLDKRLVHNIYLESASEILDHLRNNPKIVLEVIIPRFEQKTKEWEEIYERIKEDLTNVMLIHHTPSHNAVGKLFKVMDRKRLNSYEYSWNELQEVSKRTITHDDSSLCKGMFKFSEILVPSSENLKTRIQTENDWRFFPCMRLDFVRDPIHEHCFNVILHSCNRSKKWLYFWRQLFHRLFNFKLQTESWKLALQDFEHSSDSEVEDENEIENWNRFIPQSGNKFSVFEMCNHSEPSDILFVNKQLYLFLRFYSLLYNRLNKAHELSGRNSSLYAKESEPQETNESHKEFYVTLYQYLNGEISDEEQFELKLYQLLGPQSYRLVTLKELLKSMEKLLSQMFTNDREKILKQIRLFRTKCELAKKMGTDAKSKSIFARSYYQHFISLFGNKDVVHVQFFRKRKEMVMSLLDRSLEFKEKKRENDSTSTLNNTRKKRPEKPKKPKRTKNAYANDDFVLSDDEMTQEWLPTLKRATTESSKQTQKGRLAASGTLLVHPKRQNEIHAQTAMTFHGFPITKFVGNKPLEGELPG